ncbi:unnamed protein product [Timema podura]|uniref:Uncharacterized protein n=1 Tax=Timema podura TaxID=61482 RepID=A0ABN7PF04_TIMPD|nr:unnamed protein product [Timema podura]
MKVVFIGASYATIYLMYLKFKATYDHNHDTFRIEFLIIPAVALSLLINHDFSVLEVSGQQPDHVRVLLGSRLYFMVNNLVTSVSCSALD